MKSIIFLALIATIYAQTTCNLTQDLCAALGGGNACPDANLNAFTLGNTSYSGNLFNAISFGQITLTRGDIQGRVLSQGNFYSNDGTSVADFITQTTGPSLVIGGDIVYSGTGEVYPVSQPIFVRGSVTVPSNLQSRIINCASFGSSDCLTSSSFSNLLSYWTSISSLLGGQTSNIANCSDNGVLYLNCQNSNTVLNVINLDAADFNNIRGYCISPVCSSSAIFVFNIGGTADVTFQGVAILQIGYVIYNVLATSATRNVIINTSVNGNILAVNGNIIQNGGTITGVVIAANMTNIIQINLPFCRSVARDVASNTSSCDTTSICYQGSIANSTTASSTSTATGGTSDTTGVISATTGESSVTTGVTGTTPNSSTAAITTAITNQSSDAHTLISTFVTIIGAICVLFS